jgi:hypothetical protein
MDRCAGTVTAMKASPSPYLPGPHLKKRVIPATRSGCDCARNARRTADAFGVVLGKLDNNIPKDDDTLRH